MKIKLPEHDHKLTNILKVLLFSLLMLLPFLDIGTRCGYVLLNKNAYQSYSQKENTDVVNVNLNTTLVEGAIYNVNPFGINTNVNTYHYEVLDNRTNIKSLYFPNDSFTTITKFAMATSSGRTRLLVYDENNTTHSVFNITDMFYFVSNGVNELNASLDNWYTMTTLVYTQSTIDNVFDYSINKMAESPLYNWTTQTGMYTGVNAMTTGLGITTPLFAILITYWMFLTIIYIILDIVLSLFTFMTHIFTKKD